MTEALAIVYEAGKRYWNDPEFHARVYRVVATIERGQPDGYDRFNLQGATIGAAVALHLTDYGVSLCD